MGTLRGVMIKLDNSIRVLIKPPPLLGFDIETWLDVTDYEGCYQISNLGRIRSLDRTYVNSLGVTNFKSGKILKIREDRDTRYSSVHLSKNSIKKRYSIHRLVADAFIPNPKNKPIVNHKNGVRSDNRVNNLEWVTYSENSIHAMKTGISKALGETHYLSTLSNKEVLDIINLLDNSDMTYKDIGLKFNVAESTIKSINRGVTWNHITNRKDNLPKLKTKGEDHPRSRTIINCRGIIFHTQREAASFYGLKSHKSISEALLGNQKSAGKYEDGTKIRWKYKDNALDGNPEGR